MILSGTNNYQVAYTKPGAQSTDIVAHRFLFSDGSIKVIKTLQIK